MAAVMPIQTLLIKGYLAGEEAEAAGASRPPSESPRSEVPRLDIAAGGDSKDTELLPLFRHAAAIAYTYWLAQADGFAMRALDESPAAAVSVTQCQCPTRAAHSGVGIFGDALRLHGRDM